ncbi:MAG: sulfatase-like hydrolase/transferase, partial [Spirochaetota bacterium]
MDDDRPNIVIVTTDQQRRDTISGYGSAFTATPNLDRLGREGVFFDRAYCTNPTCTPARASLFSGLYPSRHGAWNIGTNVPDDLPMISHRLGAAGYRTHYVGKAHFEAYGGGSASVEGISEWRSGKREGWNGPYHGFDSVELALGHATYGLNGHYGEWLRSQLSEQETEAIANGAVGRQAGPEFGGEAYDWNMPSRLHNSVWTADRAIEFLQKVPRSTPFLLAVGFQDPHHPHCVPTDFEDRVDPAAVPLPRFTEGELDDKPPHFVGAHAGRLEEGAYRGDHFVGGQGPGYDYRAALDGDAREGRAYYHTLVRLIDREMGRILDSLDELGLAENTIVVFTTD